MTGEILNDRITMKTPLVEMDGDEMTQSLAAGEGNPVVAECQLKTEYFDLDSRTGDATEDQPPSFGGTHPTARRRVMRAITPNAARMTEYQLKQM
jgi:isocitrate dehydrogenase